MSTSSPLPPQADSPTLKRAFSTPNSSFPSKKLEQSFTHCSNRPSTSPQVQRWPSNTATRCPRSATPTKTPRPSMVQTSARSFMPMPSFGSVFGGELHNTGLQDHADANGGNVALPASSGNTITGAPFSSFHMHHDSRDSNSTASSDNSPTTTISTMDSSSVTDPSPGPSPESPLAKTAAPSSFVADFRSRRTEPSPGDSSPNNFFELQRPTTPAKKPRNLKNLGINTTSSLGNLRAHTPAPVAVVPKEKNSSAPPSPLFIKPPTPPKRRPSNLSLTISTPGSTENKPVRLIIPSTPSFNRPALRHFQSSPSLPLCSPSTNPMGGMQLPSLRPIVTQPSGLSEVPFEMEEEEDQEQNFDIPQSREEKPAAYPNGPICIYEAGVYLYFEPTAEQATTFDVIVNVASEVKNPFLSPATDSQKDIDARRVDGPPAESVDFATLSQRPKPASFGRRESSPTTPKATPTMQIVPPRDMIINGKTYRTPEYVHMPWEHNTDIVSDLHKLVRMMDDRVQQGKRVLVHCQCGVSRSASLIVAYGLYKDPQMSVQEAYDKAKKRSKWIGPNMNLIMQLQEFRNSLLRQNENRSYHNQGYGRRSAGFPTTRSTGTNGYSPFDREASSGSRTPRTAPLPPDCDISMQRASTGNIMAISPGPLSAPSGGFAPGFRRSWDSSQTHFDLSSQPTPTTTPYVDPKGHVVPVLSITDNDLLSAQTQAASANEVPQSKHEMTLQPPLVPNFSRQLPLRTLESSPESSIPSSREVHLGQPKPLSFGALKSPAVASFNISSFAPQEQRMESEIMSPIKTSFDINPWPQGYDRDSQPSQAPPKIQEIPAPLMSPRSAEFHMTGLNKDGIDESYGLLSPRATSFELSRSAEPQTSVAVDLSSEPPEIASPIRTQFPKDLFGSKDDKDDVLDDELRSPRATEFHMTPLKPRLADDDPFGLTSPTRTEFPGNPFDKPSSIASKEDEDRRPSFQAILPPSHQTFNGFASLDGTAQAQPTFQPAVSMSSLVTTQSPETQSRIDSLGPTVKPHIPSLELPPKAPETPRAPDHAFLSTPVKGIRTRFSSPNLREQRKLHKLQTAIESKLPKPPVAQHAADDIDALMSPRAEEFTRNPFHFDLRSTDDDTSPASSNETIKDGRNGHDWNEPLPRQWTPEKATVDPRSPVQTGSSPIVRNIWDVL
ncbi:Nn.00g024980.m01.CDS01 [Neocucurbitaria sp. VM-36]